jgi:lipopolysaccharide/colanic/teichoic acid biosynthesis glycosyltransferase
MTVSPYATGAVKAIVERALAAVILVCLLPVLLACAAAILVRDGWPVLFTETRVGRRGKLFRLIKFRSMRQEQGLEQGLPITAAGDARISILGAKLRKRKLDELPQLWNVVWGQMSLIGPRPESPGFVDFNSGEWAEILEVAPGITGAASVEYYNEEERLRGVSNPVLTYREEILPVKLAIEREWLRTSSPSVDLRLLARTVSRVVHSWGSSSAS